MTSITEHCFTKERRILPDSPLEEALSAEDEIDPNGAVVPRYLAWSEQRSCH
jgi:hypothetical protein